MVWDGLIVLLIITLTVAGWNVGIINSWRGPIAIVIATLITQQFYVDAATFVAQQLRLQPMQCIAIGYILVWCAVEVVCEVLLMIIVHLNKKTKPMFFERLFGAGFGFIKAFVVILLPCIALQGPIKVPVAPPDKAILENPLASGIEKAALPPIFSGIAKGLFPLLGPVVASNKEPSFKADFKGGQEDDK